MATSTKAARAWRASGAMNHSAAPAATETTVKNPSQGLRGPDQSAMAPATGEISAMASPEIDSAQPQFAVPISSVSASVVV